MSPSSCSKTLYLPIYSHGQPQSHLFVAVAGLQARLRDALAFVGRLCDAAIVHARVARVHAAQLAKAMRLRDEALARADAVHAVATANSRLLRTARVTVADLHEQLAAAKRRVVVVEREVTRLQEDTGSRAHQLYLDSLEAAWARDLAVGREREARRQMAGMRAALVAYERAASRAATTGGWCEPCHVM